MSAEDESNHAISTDPDLAVDEASEAVGEDPATDAAQGSDVENSSEAEEEVPQESGVESASQPLLGDSENPVVADFKAAEDPARGFLSAEAPPGHAPEPSLGGDGVPNPDPSQPSDAVQPPKPTRDFYMIRVPRPDLSKTIAKIKVAEQKLSEKREKQIRINSALTAKKNARSEALASLKQARERSKACSIEVQNKFEEIKPLQETLKKFQDVNSTARNKARDLQCTSEYELDQMILDMEYKLEHESLSLTEEKNIMREMKILESSRSKVRANEALFVSVTDSMGHRDAVQARLKPLVAEVEVLKMEREAAKKICDTFDAEFKAMDQAVTDLMADRSKANLEQDNAFHELVALRQQCTLEEQEYRQNIQELGRFRKLASENDVKALEELCNEQVERILRKLSDDKEYRKKYYKDMEWSVVKRFNSYDTRRPGMNDQPISLSQTSSQAPEPNGFDRGAGSAEPKSLKPQKKEDAPLTSSDVKKSGTQKKTKETKDVKKSEKEDDAAATAAKRAAKSPKEEKTDAGGVNKDVEVVSSIVKEGDIALEEEMKEKRREEAMARQKEAEERKKKKAEKDKARAEFKAKKEAEELAKKREKEKEKRARKKALASGQNLSEQEKTTEEDNDNENTESGDVAKGGDVKDTSIDPRDNSPSYGKASIHELTRRQRKRNAVGKSPDVTFPLKRKKNIWEHSLFWPVIVLTAIILFVAIYYVARKIPVSSTQ